MCYFEGQYYPLGHVLEAEGCTNCTCKTPPDFTCIHISCPMLPNEYNMHCEYEYKPGVCCPDYHCTPIQEKGKFQKYLFFSYIIFCESLYEIYKDI